MPTIHFSTTSSGETHDDGSHLPPSPRRRRRASAAARPLPAGAPTSRAPVKQPATELRAEQREAHARPPPVPLAAPEPSLTAQTRSRSTGGEEGTGGWLNALHQVMYPC